MFVCFRFGGFLLSFCSGVNDQRNCRTREKSGSMEFFSYKALSLTLMSLLERNQPISVKNPGDYGSHTAVTSLHGHRGAAFTNLAAG